MKKNQQNKSINNRRAKFDYQLSDSFVVGIVLNGRETKALRMGHGQLQGAYVTIKNSKNGGELWLVNATIHGTNGIPIEDSEKTHARKLLAKRREINQIITAKTQGKTIIPTEILTQGKFIKVRIALGVGKKHYDKRQTLKKRDDERNTRREIARKIS